MTGINRLRYVQNRRHWCWAVACKMAGEQYKRKHLDYTFSIIRESPVECGQVTPCEYDNGVVTENTDGINWQLQKGNKVRVDAWQRAIVMNANTTKYKGYDGDVDGDDEAKARGIRYYLTGDTDSNRVGIETLGCHDAADSLLETAGNKIMLSLQRGEYVIGNAVSCEKKEYHSLVLLSIWGEKVMLYDPADGEILYHSVREVFCDGFRYQSGTGIIKWVQRIC